MKDYSEKTLAKLCLEASRRYGDKTAFAMIRDGTIDEESRISYSQMAESARRLGITLRQMGVNPADRVLLLSENCPEWPLALFGIAMAGAISVPLLTGFSAEQVQNIAGHAGISAVILSKTMASKIKGLPENLPLLYTEEITGTTGKIAAAISFMENTGQYPQQKDDDPAVIIYTSGTSGNSKGVMLSGANMISSAAASLKLAKINPRDRTLSILPLAHAYECSLGLIAPVMGGAAIYYLDRPPSPSVLLPALQLIRPTVMTSVPVIIEKMYRSAISPKLKKSRLYRFPVTRLPAILAAGGKLKRALGGCIRFFGIGGAPLAAEVEIFLRRIRFPYAIGYGLTEAAPLVAGTMPRRFPFRSTGAVSPGSRLRIASQAANTGVGEIQVQGPNVMLGYYRNEEETKKAFTSDGWLRTGDLGRIDKKSRLYVCGRLKALILGPGGENIYPEEIEGLLGSSQLIEEALVYPGEKGELIALVRLSDAAKTAVTNAAFAVEHVLEDLRSWANKKLAGFSRLSKIIERQEPFEKTPTMKIKRHLYVEPKTG